MRKASVLLARLTRQLHYHWVGIFGSERMQSFINLFQTREIVKARAPGANFPDSLWPTEHQHAHHGQFGLRQMKDFRGDVFKFRHTAGAAMKDVSEILFAQTIKRLLDLHL